MQDSIAVNVTPRAFVLVVALATGMLVTDGSRAEESRAVPLLQKYKCYICHANEETKAGPAYIDVAGRYKGNPKAIAIVAAIVRKGEHGGGPWNMPPHPEVSRTDAEAMARYILSLK